MNILTASPSSNFMVSAWTSLKQQDQYRQLLRTEPTTSTKAASPSSSSLASQSSRWTWHPASKLLNDCAVVLFPKDFSSFWQLHSTLDLNPQLLHFLKNHPGIRSSTSLLCWRHATILFLHAAGKCYIKVACYHMYRQHHMLDGSNRLKLNPTKSEFLWCAMARRLHHIDNSVFHLDEGILCMAHLYGILAHSSMLWWAWQPTSIDWWARVFTRCDECMKYGGQYQLRQQYSSSTAS